MALGRPAWRCRWLAICDRYPQGVWLADLAPIADPAGVPAAVADAVGVREEVGQPLLATLVAALRLRHLLLVLDNCEHLLDACALLVQALLRGCPGVTVLATSREGIGLAGEIVWRVPSMALPDGGICLRRGAGPGRCGTSVC